MKDALPLMQGILKIVIMILTQKMTKYAL